MVLVGAECPGILTDVGEAAEGSPADQHLVLTWFEFSDYPAGARLPRIEAGALDEEQLFGGDQETVDEQVHGISADEVDFNTCLADHRLTGFRANGLDLRRPSGPGPVRRAKRYSERDHANEGQAQSGVDGAVVAHRQDCRGCRRTAPGGERGTSVAVMRTNPVLTKLGAYPIAALHERARAMRAAGEPLLDFSIGDPREPTPAFVPEELRRSVPAVSQYPTTSGLPELRGSIATYVHRRFGVDVDPDSQVLPTAGSKEAIFSTPLAFVDRAVGSAVVWATPGYPIYERGALLAGAEGFPVTLDGDFVLRPTQVPDAVWDRTALIWINYPHNPTGAVIDRSGLDDLYARANRAGAWVCSDECYVDVYEGEPPPSILQVAGTGFKGALSYLSLSKRSGMTGYRTAAIVGDAEGIAILKDLRTSTGTASPEFIQKAAITAWDDDSHAAERRDIFAAKRAILRTAFEDTGHDVVASKAGIYIWARVGDDVAVAERLLKRGIVVSPGRAFGAGGEGFLRLALIPTLEETQQATEVLKTCLIEI